MEGERIFVRSESVPKGAWGRHLTYRIEDIPDSRREEVIQHMLEHFFRDEPITTVVSRTSPYSEEDKRTFLNNVMNDQISLIAVDESNNDEIVGVSINRVTSRCAPDRHRRKDVQMKSIQEVLIFLLHCHDGVDPFTYNSGENKVVVDYVLEPMGLSVSRKHRRKGIGEALIKARHKLAANLEIGATQGLYSSIYSQTIILRQPGMGVFKEIRYSDYIENGKAKYAELNPPHPSARIIGGLITKDMA